MLNQTKNRKQAGEVFVHPDIAEVKSSHPIITLVMDHGAFQVLLRIDGKLVTLRRNRPDQVAPTSISATTVL